MYDPELYWPARYRKQGKSYVAHGGRESSYTEQYNAIAPFLRERAKGRVLDFGCGPQRFRDCFEDYVGVDLIPGLGTEPLGKTLPTGFDTAVAVMVLQHIVDGAAYRYWVEQLWKCLNPGGRLLIVDHVPMDGMAEHMRPRGIGALALLNAGSQYRIVDVWQHHWMGVLCAP